MRADIHGGPEQKLQSEAGYIDARPQTDSSTKTSCNARPDHTNGSNCESLRLSKCFPLCPSNSDIARCSRHVAFGRVEDGRGSLGHSATLRFPSHLVTGGGRPPPVPPE